MGKGPSTYPVEFVIFGESTEEATVGIVSANVPLRLTIRRDFLAALRTALTEWACDTPEGRDVWEESGKDFNLCDLWARVGIGSLAGALERHEIRDLTVHFDFDDGDARVWTFDTVLMNRDVIDYVSAPPVAP